MCACTLLLQKYIEFLQQREWNGEKATWYIADIKHGVVLSPCS